MPRLLTLVLVLLVAVATPAAGRELHEDETIATRIGDVRHALALEEYQRAVRLAEELHSEHPDDFAVFWALARAYALAGMDRDHLIPLLETYLLANPGDRRGTLELASAMAREGRVDEAHALWLTRLRERALDLGGYSEIGALEVRHRMFEHAIETYLEGRSRSGEQRVFSQELARLYVQTAQHDDAIAECLLAVGENPGMVQWAMNIVEGILDTTGDDGMVKRWASTIAGRPDPLPQELSFAGSLYALVGMMDEALEAHAISDERGGRRGMELLEYARLVRDRGMPAEASRALELVRERHPTGAAAAAAGRERAGILVELGDAKGAVEELKRLAATFGNRPEGRSALIEAARVELAVLGDPASALLTLEPFEVDQERTARPTLHEAWMVEVDARIAMGDFDAAYTRAGEVIAGGAEKETLERALYARGFISFLRGENQTAIVELRDMVEQHVGSRLANDALRLMLVISDAQESGDAEQATLYASALRAEATGDVEAAMEILDEVAGRYVGMTVSSEALLRLAALVREHGRVHDALDVYDRAFVESESIVVRAEARLRRGLILKTMRGREDEAADEFEALLDELPPNHLSGQARRELEALRRRGGGR